MAVEVLLAISWMLAPSSSVPAETDCTLVDTCSAAAETLAAWTAVSSAAALICWLTAESSSEAADSVTDISAMPATVSLMRSRVRFSAAPICPISSSKTGARRRKSPDATASRILMSSRTPLGHRAIEADEQPQREDQGETGDRLDEALVADEAVGAGDQETIEPRIAARDSELLRRGGSPGRRSTRGALSVALARGQCGGLDRRPSA